MIIENFLNFDKSNLDSVTERPLIHENLMVSRILPLNRLRGALFLSDKKLYF